MLDTSSMPLETNKASADEQLSPQGYASLVGAYVQYSIGTSPIAGELFSGLGDYLNREFDQTEIPHVDIVINTVSSLSKRARQASIVRIHAVSELDKLRDILLAKHSEPLAEVSIIFMRGHQPPQCLTRIGSTCNINPFFFLRHLEYLWAYRPLKLFTFPSLPSSSCTTVRLKMITLGEHEERGGWVGSPKLQDLRARSQNSMMTYLENVSREYKLYPGNSIVRAFNQHSARYFSIEQEMTVTVQRDTTGWRSRLNFPLLQSSC